MDIRKTIYGVAVADAIGNPIEFMLDPTEHDVSDSMNNGTMFISDDTQMSLFLLEYLTGGHDLSAPTFEVPYLRWFKTQVEKFAECQDKDGLLQFKSLFRREAPGTTCISACKSLLHGLPVINDSKGNGSVMRVAPIAWASIQMGLNNTDAIRLARLDAITTHKHPYAAQCSAVLVQIYRNLHLDGLTFTDAVRKSIGDVGVELYVETLLLDSLSPNSFSRLKNKYGGWVAEEALALAISAIASTDGDYLDVVKNAVCIEGDSDTVGAIAGGLLAGGLEMEVPSDLIQNLNALDAIHFATEM